MSSILTGEGGCILLEQTQLVAQLGHGVTDNDLLVLILGLEIGECHLGGLFIGLEHIAQCADLFAFHRQQTLQLDNLLLQLFQLLSVALLHSCKEIVGRCLNRDVKKIYDASTYVHLLRRALCVCSDRLYAPRRS